MGISSNEIQAKFTADISDLNRGFESATSSIKKTVDQVNKNASQVGERAFSQANSAVDRHGKKIGQALTGIGNILGQTEGQFARFGGQAVQAFGNITEAIQFPGGLNPALIGIGAAMAIVLPKLSEFGNAFKQRMDEISAAILKITFPDLIRELDLLTLKAKGGFGTDEAKTKFEQMSKAYELGLKKIQAEFEISKDATKKLQQETDLAKQTLIDLKTEFDLRQLTSINKDAFEKVLNVAERLKENQEKLFDIEGQLAAQRRASANFAVGAPADFVGPVQEPNKADASEKKIADVIVPPNTSQLLQQRFDQIKENLASNNKEITALVASGADAALTAYNGLAQGIGDAVASAIVYNEDLGKSLEAVLKNVAASVISSLVQIGIQQVILAVLGKTLLATQSTSQIAAAGAQAAAWASVASVRELGLVGIGAAPAFAAAAVATTLASASAGAAAGAGAGAGFAAFADGGIVKSPVLGLVGEAGPEVIAPLSKLDSLVEPRQDTRVILQLDRRTFAEWTVRDMPAVLRLHGVKA